MKASTLTQLIAATLLIAGIAATASADQKLMLINPEPDHHNDIPSLGFYGYQTCQGMVVESVVRGTEAWRIGLERGDVILSIDGQRLNRNGDYEHAMRHVGNVTYLRVKDVKGRGVFTVKARLRSFNNNRPIIEYRSLKH